MVDTEELYHMFSILGGHPVGGRTLVRYRLHRTIDKLKIDDDLIQRLGVDSLDFHEVVAACVRRGISIPPIPSALLEGNKHREELKGVKTFGQSSDSEHSEEQDGTAVGADPRSFSQAQLNVWLDLAHIQKVPIALLLHLRTFVSAVDNAKLSSGASRSS